MKRIISRPVTFAIAVLVVFPLILLLLGVGVTNRARAVGADITAAYVANATCGQDDPAWESAVSGTSLLNQSFETYYAPMRFELPPNVAEPFLPNRTMEVSAIHNGTDLCLKFKWSDDTENTTFDDTSHFMDAMAFGIPFNGDVTPSDPPKEWPKNAEDWLSVCGAQGYHMGSSKDENGNDLTTQCATNLDAWMGDFAPGDKLENFTAVGIGTVTGYDSEELPTATYGQYDTLSKTWTVVFQRPLDPSPISANMVKLEAGHTYLIGYVQWDGALNERDGRKFVTEDWADTLTIEAVP